MMTSIISSSYDDETMKLLFIKSSYNQGINWLKHILEVVDLEIAQGCNFDFYTCRVFSDFSPQTFLFLFFLLLLIVIG